MSATSRRAILAGIAAAVPAASAVASIASNADAELRRLWSEYLKQSAAFDAASEKMKSARAAFDAELPPCPDDVLPGDHWSAHRWLWEKHGLEALNNAWNAEYSAMLGTITTILQTKVEGLAGIGVKLAALPADCDGQDCKEAVASVLEDIDRLLGSDFTRNFAERGADAEERDF
jgi:hypothetical protein